MYLYISMIRDRFTHCSAFRLAVGAGDSPKKKEKKNGGEGGRGRERERERERERSYPKTSFLFSSLGSVVRVLLVARSVDDDRRSIIVLTGRNEIKRKKNRREGPHIDRTGPK